jgi:hypothetical protein
VLTSPISRTGDAAALTIAWATWMLGITAARNWASEMKVTTKTKHTRQ